MRGMEMDFLKNLLEKVRGIDKNMPETNREEVFKQMNLVFREQDII